MPKLKTNHSTVPAIIFSNELESLIWNVNSNYIDNSVNKSKFLRIFIYAELRILSTSLLSGITSVHGERGEKEVKGETEREDRERERVPLWLSFLEIFSLLRTFRLFFATYAHVIASMLALLILILEDNIDSPVSIIYPYQSVSEMVNLSQLYVLFFFFN